MQIGLQDLLALGVVFAAAGYLVRLALGAVANRTGPRACSSCGGCPTAAGRSSQAPEQVVSIGPVPRKP